MLTGRQVPKPDPKASDKGQVRQAEGTETDTKPAPEAGPDTDADRAWDDSPLRAKITVLAMLGVMSVVGIGMIESHSGHTIWPLLVGLMRIGVALSVLARVWIWQPIEHLIEDVRQVAAKLPNDPFKGPCVTLKLNLAPFVWLLLDKAIETAIEVEGKSSYIGGRVHLVVLHSSGVEVMNPDDNVKLIL